MPNVGIAPGGFIRASDRKKVRGYPQVSSFMLGGDFERLASTLGELDKDAEGSQHINRTGISSCLLRNSDEALPVPCKVTWSVALNFWTNCQNRLHSSALRSRCSFVGLIFTPRHRAARRMFAKEHQNWQVRHWCPLLFRWKSVQIKWIQRTHITYSLITYRSNWQIPIRGNMPMGWVVAALRDGVPEHSWRCW